MFKFLLCLFSTLFTIISFSYPAHRCLPSQSCWPKAAAWAQLNKQVHGRLVKPQSPTAACLKSRTSAACKAALKRVKNPFYLQSRPGNTENQGWFHAWQSTPSTYAVEVKTPQDVAATINFARKYNLRLVIKGAGHDYLGRSNAPDSLLIWTHNMRKISYSKHFVPMDCSRVKAVPVITVGAGTRWVEAYGAATTQHHQYVQGGGCATVGAAGGFTQGGGFGSYSKAFGTGAGGVLQVQVVTPNGKIVTANQCVTPELFWAIRGGGGGTYGVVTKMTLRLHPLPKYFGVIRGTITAKDDRSYHQLIQHFLGFFAKHLNNQHWGEQFAFTPENKLTIFMMSQGLSQKQALAVWQPLKNWVKHSKGRYQFTSEYFSIPPVKMWNYQWWKQHHPDLVTKNTLRNARAGEYWWTPNTGEAFRYWYSYESWWLPKRLLSETNLAKTADIFYKMSRLASVSLHINKGLAGASKQAIALSKETSTNPKVYQAAALVLMSAGTDKLQIGPRTAKQNQKIEKTVKSIHKAMTMLMEAAPNAGSYANEADYFQKNWQQVFWGQNYAKLLRIKKHVDPTGLLHCHHCVGG